MEWSFSVHRMDRRRPGGRHRSVGSAGADLVVGLHQAVGVIGVAGRFEARRDGELYGLDRLAGVVGASLERPAAEIAGAVMDDCRSFAGDLADDCALVVIKR